MASSAVIQPSPKWSMHSDTALPTSARTARTISTAAAMPFSLSLAPRPADGARNARGISYSKRVFWPTVPPGVVSNKSARTSNLMKVRPISMRPRTALAYTSGVASRGAGVSPYSRTRSRCLPPRNW